MPRVVFMCGPAGSGKSTVRARALDHGDEFVLDPHIAASYFAHFQPPTEDEGPLVVIA